MKMVAWRREKRIYASNSRQGEHETEFVVIYQQDINAIIDSSISKIFLDSTPTTKLKGVSDAYPWVPQQNAFWQSFCSTMRSRHPA